MTGPAELFKASRDGACRLRTVIGPRRIVGQRCLARRRASNDHPGAQLQIHASQIEPRGRRGSDPAQVVVSRLRGDCGGPRVLLVIARTRPASVSIGRSVATWWAMAANSATPITSGSRLQTASLELSIGRARPRRRPRPIARARYRASDFSRPIARGDTARDRALRRAGELSVGRASPRLCRLADIVTPIMSASPPQKHPRTVVLPARGRKRPPNGWSVCGFGHRN
jgi:hypothetical protein